MLSTSALRSYWAPRCRGPWLTINLHGQGRVTVRPAIRDAVRALNACLIAWNYRTRRHDTGAYNCRTGGAGWSLHAYGIALDINWNSNPYSRKLITDMPRGMVNSILSIRTNNGKQVWGWGGNWRTNKDAMHYEIVCRPADLATGINWRTVPGYKSSTPQPAPKPAPKPEPKKVEPPKPKGKKVLLIQARGQDAVYITDLVTKSHVTSPQNRDVFKFLLKSMGFSPDIAVLDASFVNSIPTNPSAADRLKTVAGIINGVTEKIKK